MFNVDVAVNETIEETMTTDLEVAVVYTILLMAILMTARAC